MSERGPVGFLSSDSFEVTCGARRTETGGKIKARFIGARFTVMSGIQTSSLTFTLDVYRSATKSKKSEPIDVE